MHEYSLVRSLLDTVDTEARARGARTVDRVHVRIGELAGVEVELFATAYDLCRQGTMCGRAVLEIDRVAATWTCPTCDQATEPAETLRCRACHGPLRLVSGDEIVLDRIELEVD